MERCVCCKAPGDYSVLLAGEAWHYYLPNQGARKDPELAQVRPVWFCNGCMRVIEDTLRGVIAGLTTAHEKYGK